MKTRWLVCALIAAASVGFFAGVGYSEDPQPSEDEMMKQMLELGKPGPMHKILKGMVGEWDTAMKVWMEPGKEPTLSKGRAVNRMILDGRYLHQQFVGSFSGMPHRGTGFIGHDNFGKKYQSIWIDNFSSAFSIAEGKAGEDGKSLHLTYEWDSPMGKIPGRYVWTITGKDSHRLEGWMSQGGQEMKSMEIDFTRKKKKVSKPDCR